MTRRIPTRLSDIARLAGVSLSTASRALANPALVQPATLERVREVAARMGYVPHGAARALASHRTRTVGAVFPPVENPVFATGTHALARRLEAAGYTLLLASHEYDASGELDAARRLVERGVDGMVLVGIDHDPALFAMLDAAGVPYELTWAVDPAGLRHSVGIVHRTASAQLARHLIGLGHRRFAVIAGQTTRNDRARERLAGVREALAESGLALPAEHVLEVPFAVAEGRRACAHLLDRTAGFTALVCGNDPLAIGALVECQRRGIAVPETLSIVGFDDIELAAELAPGITTVHVPSATIGERAGERLLARLAGVAVVRVEELPARLVVRGSSGRAPARRTRLRSVD